MFQVCNFTLLFQAPRLYHSGDAWLDAGCSSKFGYIYAKSLARRASPLEIHARRCMLPEGVLGDGSGLHRGDGLAPCSEVAAEAEIWISLICPSPFGH